MFFILSKLLVFIIAPIVWIIVLLFVSVFLSVLLEKGIVERNTDILQARIVSTKKQSASINFEEIDFLYGDVLFKSSSLKYGGEKDYPTYLIDTVESLIQLEVQHLSPDESKRSLSYVLRHIKGAIALLDRENVNFDELKKHVLDECKVLNRHVTDIDFYTDMFKNIQYLLIKRTVPAKEHIALNIELERLIVLLYSRLKSVIGSDIIRDELLVSPKLSLSAHSAIKRE